MCDVRHAGPEMPGLPAVPVAHMSGWSGNGHVIKTPGSSAGIRWLVIHLESMTQLLGDKDAGGAVRPEPGAAAWTGG